MILKDKLNYASLYLNKESLKISENTGKLQCLHYFQYYPVKFYK